MAILSNVLDDFIKDLSRNAHYKDVKIIKAYPYVVKPTKLNKIVLCVGLGEVKASGVSVGDSYVYGEYEVRLDAFSPYDIGANKIIDLFKLIIDDCTSYNPIGIKIVPVSSDRDTLCYIASCILTFNDTLNIGGANNE